MAYPMSSNTVRIGRAPGTPEQLAPTGSDYIARNGGMSPAGSHDGMGSVSSFYQLQAGPTPNDVLQSQAKQDQYGMAQAQLARGQARADALNFARSNPDAPPIMGAPLHSWDNPKLAPKQPAYDPATAPALSQQQLMDYTDKGIQSGFFSKDDAQPFIDQINQTGEGPNQQAQQGLSQLWRTGAQAAFNKQNPSDFKDTPQGLSLSAIPDPYPKKEDGSYKGLAPAAFTGGGSYSGPMGDDREMRRLSMGTPQEREFGYHMGQQKALADERMSDRRSFNADRTQNTHNQFLLNEQKQQDTNESNKRKDSAAIIRASTGLINGAANQKVNEGIANDQNLNMTKEQRQIIADSRGDETKTRLLAKQFHDINTKADQAHKEAVTMHEFQNDMREAYIPAENGPPVPGGRGTPTLTDKQYQQSLLIKTPKEADAFRKMVLGEDPATAKHKPVGIETLPTGEKVFHHGNGTASLIVDPKPAPEPHFSAEKSHTIAEKLRTLMFDPQTGKASTYYNNLDANGQKDLWDEYNYHRDNSRPYLKKGQQAVAPAQQAAPTAPAMISPPGQGNAPISNNPPINLGSKISSALNALQ
jgi:hypothetical protein